MAWVKALDRIDEVGEAPTVLHRYGVTVRGGGVKRDGPASSVALADGFVAEFETIVKEVRRWRPSR